MITLIDQDHNRCLAHGYQGKVTMVELTLKLAL